jgi:hypothetical protein
MSLLRSGQTWEALGPFPLGTRELPYLSSPLHAFVDPSSDTDPFLSAPFGAVFPSAYGINGTASWLSLHPDEHGWVDVQWEPHLASWEGVRRSEGWAGLQHLALIRSEIDIPVAGDYRGLLVQGHAWSVVPQGRRRKEIEWVTGDIYAFSEGLGDEVDRQSVYGQVVHLDKGKHWVYLKALYEIRA